MKTNLSENIASAFPYATPRMKLAYIVGYLQEGGNLSESDADEMIAFLTKKGIFR